MKIYNSLTKQVDKIEPYYPGRIGMYTCGPTVYDYVSIGNWRTYVLSDWIVRALKAEDMKVTYVMNITDVGHLTGDNLGDADQGEDRLEKAAIRESKSAWEISKFYTENFLEGYKRMNLMQPKVFSVATEHIQEQIEMVREIEEAGFTYKIDDGVYFDTKAYEVAGNKYGELSNIDQVKAGARVEPNVQKKDPRDFALWKFSPQEVNRQMEWESPWGKGFPGWHIECSAMSRKYLGEQFEVHAGGEDLKSTHHPNEIAQAEAASGKKPFVKYWIHGAFLQVDGGRMGKSLGNAYRLEDIKDKGFEPMDLKYFYLTGHWRKPLNFTWEALADAKEAREKLVRKYFSWNEELGGEQGEIYKQAYWEAIDDDLNMPQALAQVWKMARDENLAGGVKRKLLEEFNQVLGLRLSEDWKALVIEVKDGIEVVAEEGEWMEMERSKVCQWIEKREEYRQTGDFQKADEIRKQMEEEGLKIEDERGQIKVTKRQ